MVKPIFAAPEELELVTEGQAIATATATATAAETSSFINVATDLLLEVKDEEISLLKKRLAEFEATTKMEKEKERVEKSWRKLARRCGERW